MKTDKPEWTTSLRTVYSLREHQGTPAIMILSGSHVHTKSAEHGETDKTSNQDECEKFHGVSNAVLIIYPLGVLSRTFCVKLVREFL